MYIYTIYIVYIFSYTTVVFKMFNVNVDTLVACMIIILFAVNDYLIVISSTVSQNNTRTNE